MTKLVSVKLSIGAHHHETTYAEPSQKELNFSLQTKRHNLKIKFHYA